MTVSGNALPRLVRAGVLDPVTATRIELEQLGVTVPDFTRGEPVSYTDSWANIDTDLRDAGQRELADRIKRMREQGDA